MPAYSFQRQFVEPVLAKTKGGTIRATHKAPAEHASHVRRVRHATTGGHAYPGERLVLYTGMRTKHCRLFAERTCLATTPIKLYLSHPRLVELPSVDIHKAADLDRFAVFDGFASFDGLVEFWEQAHPGVEIFDGWHIRWMELPHG